MYQQARKVSDVLGAALASLGMNVPGMRELSRKNYTPRSVHFAKGKLDRAFDQHIDDIKPGAQVGYRLDNNTPQGDTALDRLHEVATTPGNVYAGSSAPGKSPLITINPKAGREFFAHELGHLASQQTDLGHLAATLRHNPKLAKVLGTAAMGIGAGTVATLNDGNNEYDEAALLGVLASAPALADEALATRHGLAIMDKAGMRASLGQRGKLAASLMSYAAPAVIASLIGTTAGNTLEAVGDTLAG